MTFDEYQEWAKSTAVYPVEAKVFYPLLGLVGETGEVIEKLTDKMELEFTTPEAGNSEEAQKILRAYALLCQVVDIGRELEVLKKDFRKNGIGQGIQIGLALNPLEKKGVVKELGDQDWYRAAVCTDLGVSMGEVAAVNIEKLESRKARGTLDGSGDNR